ncbi:exopolysaccharide biosynthesis WecB/TagA/CpsF family protein [Rhodobium orientis]|uniref:UDP-phosphate galactose phosphotransferase n=1 Tax=Rhodobium orientis TaxID=34017 RepID=A0A327JKT7_9HYPH|nr:WecB/TagA/CpsF family glycosyltransferase [Rhodobium orientis]MBB4303170.1 exopolysaccharide biosynthesis WecB/TagA/CpsF family protein [Rhodobium orientis]MBK5951729.1 UDP-phosphate galactose phosphotransferase [Rhodobium orientis]RAI26959.1 UDP-phosphate galactose phosphotransferase [Rhodobium orientis]
MNALQKIRLFSLDIVNAIAEDALEQMLKPGARRTAAFVNAHCVNVAAKTPVYTWALKKADFLLPDGSGLQLAAKLQGQRFVENLNGTDLFVPLCRKAAARGLSIYFLGSADGVAHKASEAARRIAPALKVAGTHHGYFSSRDEDRIIDDINASGADIVLVALGVPQQDVWIARNRHRINARLVMGVGAQFDFWSGRVSRAPRALRTVGMEWMWRLAIEPRRMFTRYVVGNPQFMLRAWTEARSKGAMPAVDARGKRALDLLGSFAGIFFFAPLMMMIALAIKLESRGPVFFRQTRIGRGGQPFTVLKFRSMYRDAEARRAALLAQSDRAGICFKSKNDPRVTRIGRLLRRFSLDELPQLFNIWRGDMGIVGPRPALPQEVEAYPPEARERLIGKPGLTGLWQVSGRAEIGFNKMIHMDSAYVRSRSVFLDIALITLTVRAVFTGRGAY